MNYDNLHIDAMFVVLLIGRAQQHSCEGWTHQGGRPNFTGGKNVIIYTHLHMLIHNLIFQKWLSIILLIQIIFYLVDTMGPKFC